MSTSARKLALVTGTTSGVGSATATLLLEHGWDVIGVSRSASTRSHERYRHVMLDLGDLPAVVSVLEAEVAPTLAHEWSRVALVNNAASADLLGPVETLDALELSRLYSVNLVTPLWSMGFISRQVPRDVALRIVNVSSLAATYAVPGLAAYSSAKAGLRMAGMVVAAEWASTAVHARTRMNAAILSYEPGAVDTPMQHLARSRSPMAFPWVDVFIGIRDRGGLVEPERPAAEIVAYLEADGLPPFSERRLGR
jgi:benzil reductase ((S)-benzoin forming)